MAFLIKLVFGSTTGRTLRQFRDACRDPVSAQKQTLDTILLQNASSPFGKRYGFASVNSVNDYQKAVPLGDYDSLYPYIKASMDGEPGLTVSPPIFYAVTSGTTGASKFIPVTRESHSAKSQTMKIFLSALYRDHPQVFDGRILTVVSPEVESYTPSGIPCGSESGYSYRNMPVLLRALYSSPYDVYEIEDYDARYYALMRIAAGQDIRVIYIINPSTLLLMIRILGERTASIIKDIRDGTLSKEIRVDNRIRQVIESGLKPDPERAAELEKAAEAADHLLVPEHVWPNLSVLCCWKGGNVSFYVDKLAKYFRENLPVRDIGYLASEHRSSVPLTDEGSSGALAVGANFYEFVPAEKERPFHQYEALQPHMLEVGRQYYVIITNHAGLYRYDMDDIVEVTGYYHNSPLIRFVQKGKGSSSFTGEKLYEGQVISAIEQAFKARQGHYEFIAAVGQIRGETPTYVFLVEFDDPCSDEDGRELLRLLEKELRTRNIEYAAKRDSLRISPPVLRIVKQGEFERFRKRKIEQGRPDSQFKIIRLTSDAKIMDEFSYDREINIGADQK